MKRLIFEYLKMRFPTAYRKQTKFGVCVYYDKEVTFEGRKREILNDLMAWFSCDGTTAFEMLRSWEETLPQYKSIGLSTNPDVLIMDTF